MHTLLPNKYKEKTVVLSERLSVIAESLSENAVVCDVGSDHGDLPLYLLQTKKTNRVIVTDLNKKPLARAKEKIESAGFSQYASFVLTDGIEKVLNLSPDVFVIAGMGGETISGILDRANSGIPLGTSFVLQPMTKPALLREFLYKNGFNITNETVVFENEKFFPVIWAEFDHIKRLEKIDSSFLGEFIVKDGREESKLYFQKLLEQVNEKILGRSKAGVEVLKEEKQKIYLESLLKEFS